MKEISRFLIYPFSTIREAIRVIDEVAAQIALVVDADRRLLGTVTDGDIRRGLLRGEALDSPVEQVMNSNFRSLPEACPTSQALRLMREEVLHQIPVLDSEGRVVRLFLLEDLLQPQTLPNWVLIMAGGQGKRLQPLTETCPKPMLRVGGKPILEIILEQCVEAGFRNFFISVNYLKQQILDHFGSGNRWGVKLRYLEENRPLGTAGALSLLPEVPLLPIIVINGDVLTRVNYLKLLQFHQEHQASATICVCEHQTQVPYGVVQTENSEVLSLEEKPTFTHYINAGIYVLDPDLLELLPPNQPYEMPQLLKQGLVQKRSILAFPIHEYWLDVGHPETLDRANGEWE